MPNNLVYKGGTTDPVWILMNMDVSLVHTQTWEDRQQIHIAEGKAWIRYWGKIYPEDGSTQRTSGVGVSPSLGTLKTLLDKALSNLI